MKRRVAVLCAAGWLSAALAVGQTLDNLPPAGGIQLGALYLEPAFAWKDFGFDSNVFNEAVNPKQDWTSTVNPRLDATLIAGRTRFTVANTTEFVYFQTFHTERHVNTRTSGRVELFSNRLRPWIEGEFVDTSERRGSDIDARARRTRAAFRAGADVLVGNRLTLALSLQRLEVNWHPDETYQGVELRQQLDKNAQTATVAARLELTPFTTFVLRAEQHQDRFTYSPERDSDSYRLLPGLEFEPDALLAGQVFIGYRAFQPLNPRIPEYRGVVYSVGVSTTILGRTKISVELDRDVDYSFELTEPYYVATSGVMEVTQHLFGPMEIVFRGGRERLAYRSITGPGPEPRVDTINLIGGGIGYRLGQTVRLGLDVEIIDRYSTTKTHRRYERTRIYARVTYGL